MLRALCSLAADRARDAVGDARIYVLVLPYRVRARLRSKLERVLKGQW